MYDALTLRLLEALKRHASERRTAEGWAGAMPPITPVAHVRNRLIRLVVDGKVMHELNGDYVYFLEEKL